MQVTEVASILYCERVIGAFNSQVESESSNKLKARQTLITSLFLTSHF